MSLSYQSKQSTFSRPRYVKKHKCSHVYDYGYCKFGTDCWEHPDYVAPSKPKQNCVHTDPISKGGWGKKFCSLGENCRSAQARKNPDMTINGIPSLYASNKPDVQLVKPGPDVVIQTPIFLFNEDLE